MDVREIERKIERTETPHVERVAVAYSGGLDSALCIALLQRKYRAKEIVAVTVDVGQGEEELNMAREKAKVLGVEPIFVDRKEEFSEVWVAKAIKANSDYLGYPVSTSMTRQLIAREVAVIAIEKGCDAIMEGSSGKGNDQYRMHNVFKLFAPNLKILVPVRDFDLTRGEEEILSRAWGIPITETIPGGDDKTLWCRSIASGAIDLDMEIPRDVWIWYVPPEEAPDLPEIVELEFENGIPVRMNGRRMKLGDIIAELNPLAGKHGIGKIDIFEDGIMDLKSREIYEAPAATVILKAHRDLEQLCLTKEEIQFKKIVDQKWAYMVYHGEWFHPLKDDLDSFIEKSQEVVSGTTRIKLYKGNVDIVARGSETRLLFPEIRSIKSASFDQRMCRDAAQIRGLPFEILARRKERMGRG